MFSSGKIKLLILLCLVITGCTKKQPDLSTSPVTPSQPVFPNNPGITNPPVTLPPSTNNPPITPGPITTPPVTPPTNVVTPTLPNNSNNPLPVIPNNSSIPSPLVNGSKIKLENIVINIPAGWKFHQDVAMPDVIILGFTDMEDKDYVRFYLANSGAPVEGMFTSGSNASAKTTIQIGKYIWNRIHGKKSNQNKSMGGTTIYTNAFWMEYQGRTYYGFGRASDASTATANVDKFLTTLE